jgi:hypothetical protein
MNRRTGFPDAGLGLIGKDALERLAASLGPSMTGGWPRRLGASRGHRTTVLPGMSGG